MGNIDDVLGLIRKGPRLISKLDNNNFNVKSVARGANDATFQFPCLIPDTIPIDKATTIARMMEKTYVAFTQSWLSLNPTIDITMDRNILQYLKRFHQNVTMESTQEYLSSIMDELMVKENEVSTYMEKVENDEYVLFTNRDKSFGVLFNRADKATMELMESHRELLNDHLSSFDLSEFPYIGNSSVYTEADNLNLTSGDVAQALIDSRVKKKEEEERDNRIRQTNMMKPPVQVNDRDLKKANDMAPYALQVRLMAVNDKNEFVQFIDFILGVKTVLHVVKSDEVMENIVRVMANRSPFFKFLRWTSGEISLFKNLILNLDDIKTDVINKSSGKSPWFGKLKRLKDRKVGVHDFTVPHALIPNTTLVISNYEAEYLKNYNAIDCYDPKIARKLIDSLFLMAFIIVDDGMQTIDIMYDGSTDFQTYSVETLEREVSLSSNRLGREIGRMISH